MKNIRNVLDNLPDTAYTSPQRHFQPKCNNRIEVDRGHRGSCGDSKEPPHRERENRGPRSQSGRPEHRLPDRRYSYDSEPKASCDKLDARRSDKSSLISCRSRSPEDESNLKFHSYRRSSDDGCNRLVSDDRNTDSSAKIGHCNGKRDRDRDSFRSNYRTYSENLSPTASHANPGDERMNVGDGNNHRRYSESKRFCYDRSSQDPSLFHRSITDVRECYTDILPPRVSSRRPATLSSDSCISNTVTPVGSPDRWVMASVDSLTEVSPDARAHVQK